MKLQDIWKNKEKILEGLTNSIFKNEFVETVAAQRNEICKSCPHVDNYGETCFLQGTQPCCSLCGCSLSLKQRSLSSACDDKRWDAVLTEEEEDSINTDKEEDDGNTFLL